MGTGDCRVARKQLQSKMIHFIYKLIKAWYQEWWLDRPLPC